MLKWIGQPGVIIVSDERGSWIIKIVARQHSTMFAIMYAAAILFALVDLMITAPFSLKFSELGW